MIIKRTAGLTGSRGNVLQTSMFKPVSREDGSGRTKKLLASEHAALLPAKTGLGAFYIFF